MNISFKKILQKLFTAYVVFVGTWLTFALCFQLFFVYLHFSGQDEKALNISNEISWKIDGTFKNDPNNIWYEGPK